MAFDFSFKRYLARKSIVDLAVHELSRFTDGVYTQDDNTLADPAHVHRLIYRMNVERTGLEADAFDMNFHFFETGGELPGGEATPTQKAAVETAWLAFLSSAASYIPSDVKRDEFRWYRFDPDDPIAGDPNRVTVLTQTAGSGSANVPPQVATTLTMRTARRRSWGRVYLPLTCDKLNTGAGGAGLMAASATITLAGYFRTFVNACIATDLVPAIWSPTLHALLSVSSVEVDDVPDIQRRRRFRHGITTQVYDTPS